MVSSYVVFGYNRRTTIFLQPQYMGGDLCHSCEFECKRKIIHFRRHISCFIMNISIWCLPNQISIFYSFFLQALHIQHLSKLNHGLLPYRVGTLLLLQKQDQERLWGTFYLHFCIFLGKEQTHNLDLSSLSWPQPVNLQPKYKMKPSNLVDLQEYHAL